MSYPSPTIPSRLIQLPILKVDFLLLEVHPLLGGPDEIRDDARAECDDCTGVISNIHDVRDRKRPGLARYIQAWTV